MVVAVVVRVLAYGVVLLPVAVLTGRSPSGDPLALGLLLLVGFPLVSLLWAAWDGARRGTVSALALWLLVAVLVGVGVGGLVSLDLAIDASPTGFVEGLATGGLLVAVPGMVGAVAGGIVRGWWTDRPR